MTALVLRIKFPPTYPLIYKTLRVDSKMTVAEAVKYIATTVNVTQLLVGSEGLYVPDEKRWLDDNQPLSAYESLQDVEHIEFKDKNAPDPEPPKTEKKNDENNGCCVIA
jgi:hypothetical protein